MALEDRFLKMLPEEKKWQDVIRVIDSSGIPGDGKICLSADSVKQKGALYIGK
jgi:hypothetical protein